MLAIDAVLELLRNGEWHDLKEISQKTQLQESKIQLVSSFLAEYSFLEFNKKSEKIKLSSAFLHFLKQVEDIESGEAASG